MIQLRLFHNNVGRRIVMHERRFANWSVWCWKCLRCGRCGMGSHSPRWDLLAWAEKNHQCPPVEADR